MTATDQIVLLPSAAAPAPPAVRRRRVLRPLVRGRTLDPAWVRPSLLGLLGATGLLYLWNLAESGYANSFYAAAVMSGAKSWKAMFYGSFDASNFITVDKPPASLWVMDLSARIFGFSSWSLLVPQALEGVAAVGILYLAVRRIAGPAAGLLAGAGLAVTPVAALMFRFDNPDALLVLLLVAAAWAVTRYLDDPRVRWMLVAGALIGLAFLTKTLQALVVLPPLAGTVLLAGRPGWRRRIRDLLAGGGAMVVAGGWWLAVVALVPASARPYIGGSQDNSELNLIFGYNGFGRLDGSESGSVVGGGRTPGAGSWGPTGLTRLFNDSFGGQASWLLPSALVLLVVGLVLAGRAGRTDRLRAGLVLWGGWLFVTGLLLSLAKGIIHPYYTVALAPGIAATAAIGAVAAWRRRRSAVARIGLAAALGAAAVWSWELLDRTPSWNPWLRYAVLAVGLVAAASILAAPGFARLRRPVILSATVAAALVAALAGPTAYSVATAASAHTGAIPSAGPTVAGSFGPGFGGHSSGGQGFGGRSFGGHSFGGRSFGGQGFGGTGGGSSPGGRGSTGGAPGAAPGAGASPGSGASSLPGRGGTSGAGGGPGGFGGRGAGGMGGLISSGTISSSLTERLEAGAKGTTWVAAVVGAESASGYELATGRPVMAIGGFNGTDPAPTLAEFQRDVAAGKIGWFVAGGVGGSGDVASQITSWVEAHYTATTVDGVTLYHLIG